MRVRNPFVQALLLILLASVIAIVGNAFASRTRRLVLPGFYPNALRVPPRVPERVAPTPLAPPAATATPTTSTPATATTAQSPAPGQPPIAVPTTTVERPAGAVPSTVAPAATATAPAVAAPPAAPAVNLARYQPHPDKAFVEISGEEAAGLYNAGVLFLDARRTSVFEEGHIVGARPMSVWEGDVDDKVNALFEERQDPSDQNKPIVIYCSGGACEDSHMLARKLWGVQFNNVYVYKDGFPDWQKRGGAVKTGAAP